MQLRRTTGESASILRTSGSPLILVTEGQSLPTRDVAGACEARISLRFLEWLPSPHLSLRLPAEDHKVRVVWKTRRARSPADERSEYGSRPDLARIPRDLLRCQALSLSAPAPEKRWSPPRRKRLPSLRQSSTAGEPPIWSLPPPGSNLSRPRDASGHVSFALLFKRQAVCITGASLSGAAVASGCPPRSHFAPSGDGPLHEAPPPNEIWKRWRRCRECYRKYRGLGPHNVARDPIRWRDQPAMLRLISTRSSGRRVHGSLHHPRRSGARPRI